MEALFQIHLSPKLQRCIIFPPTSKIAQFSAGFEKSMYVSSAQSKLPFSLSFSWRVSDSITHSKWHEGTGESLVIHPEGRHLETTFFLPSIFNVTKLFPHVFWVHFFNGIWRSTSKRSENGFLYKVTWSFSFPSYTNCHGNEPPQGGSAEFQRKPDKVIFKFLRAHFINVTLILKAEKSGLSRPACWLIAVQDGWPFDISKNRRQA